MGSFRNKAWVFTAWISLAGSAFAQGTKLWTTGRFDEMQRGAPEGVAIRNDGRLSPGPATSLLYTTPQNFVWSVADDGSGGAFVGLGGTSAGSAVVLHVTSAGNADKVFESKEIGVQALRLAPDGTLFAATSPDGKVYRIPNGGGTPIVVFDPGQTAEKPRYLWDLALGKSGEIYIATGAPAAVYRVRPGAKPELLFRTADQHIRSLLLAGNGTLWAGSDGSGVIYRFATATPTTAPSPKPFAAYAATRREITSLAIDSIGNIYAAGVGGKSAPPLPPLPVTGNVGVTVTFLQPGSASAAGSNTLVPDGSEIYRIAPDGTPQRLATLRDDVVYALAVRNSGGAPSLLAASGNRGRIYRLDLNVLGRYSEAARLPASQATAFAPGKDGLVVGTSNSGKVFRLDDADTTTGTYTSDVFDTGGFSRWGRAEIQSDTESPTRPPAQSKAQTASPAFDLYLRSGNVPNPIGGWSDWVPVKPDEGATAAPPGRYVQWKLALKPQSSVNAVAINYLPRNIAPVVDEVVVAPGARVASSSSPAPSSTVQVVLPSPGSVAQAISLVQDTNATPLTAQKDKSAVTVRWAAHDDNGDDLMFSVWYRSEGEANWHLFKDKISDRFLSFDTAQIPDGIYTVRVIASDAPVHLDADTLTGERISSTFIVDTTPPVPGTLTARLDPASGARPAAIHASLDVRDATTPIAHAEYSVDAGPWQYLEPVGGLSDALAEHYDFTAPTTAPQPGAPTPANPAEHLLAVRVYDRFDNMTSVKTVVK